MCFKMASSFKDQSTQTVECECFFSLSLSLWQHKTVQIFSRYPLWHWQLRSKPTKVLPEMSKISCVNQNCVILVACLKLVAMGLHLLMCQSYRILQEAISSSAGCTCSTHTPAEPACFDRGGGEGAVAGWDSLCCVWRRYASRSSARESAFKFDSMVVHTLKEEVAS